MRTAGGEGFGDTQTRGAESDGCRCLSAGQKGLVSPEDSRAGGGTWMMAGPRLSLQDLHSSLPAQDTVPPAHPCSPSPAAVSPLWWHHRGRVQTPSPGQGIAQRPLRAPAGTRRCRSRRRSQRPVRRRRVAESQTTLAPALPALAPRGPDTPPEEHSRGLGLSLYSSRPRWCQPHCRTAAGSPSAAMERAPNLVSDCTAARGLLLLCLL